MVQGNAMSYGYLIASKTLCPSLLKNRECRFTELGLMSGMIFYSRLEERSLLTRREKDAFAFTAQGIALLQQIGHHFYFMDFLLEHNEGDMDVAKIAKKQIDSSATIKLPFPSAALLKINQTYEVNP
jgi:hypothetical protein